LLKNTAGKYGGSSLLLRRLIFETDPQYLSLQYKLNMRSLSSVWNENKQFWLVFMKMLVFVPKTRSLHTGTAGFLDWHTVVRLSKISLAQQVVSQKQTIDLEQP
jgi:hypothetical protein